MTSRDAVGPFRMEPGPNERAMAREDGEDTEYENEIVVTGTMICGEAPVGSSLISRGKARIEQTAAQSSNQLLASADTDLIPLAGPRALRPTPSKNHFVEPQLSALD